MHELLQRFRRLAPYFKDGRKAWAVSILASLFTGATEPVVAYLMGPLIDQGFAGKIALWIVPPVIIGVFAVRGLASYVGQYTLAWAAQQGVLALRLAMFERLLKAAPALFGQRSASSLTNTLVHEVVNGSQQLAGAINTLVRDSFSLVGLLGYLLYLNWKLTLVITILMPSVAWAMRVAGKRLRSLAVASQSATDELAYVVEENVLAWRIVRLHGAQSQEGQRFQSLSERLRRLMLKAVAAQAAITPVTQVMASVALSAVVVIALWQSQQDKTTVGQFTSYVTGMLMLITPIKHLSDVMGPITRGLTAVERGLELIEQVPSEQGGPHAPERAVGRIALKGVSVQYQADAPPALSDVSLDIAAGQTVALVGPSGAGKSTLAHLLPRFADPSSGQVYLDEVALAEWHIDALRRQFALVSQDVVLFNDTVAANVALGEVPDVARVTDALRHANLLDFALGLPQGLETVVGHNGNQLSGGQRQRLAIARALYKNAPILILDEATSALDAESERLVQEALERLMQGRTTLVIAHRLATIERADRIVVMESGRIVEQGPHAQLLSQQGLYAKLHAMQFHA